MGRDRHQLALLEPAERTAQVLAEADPWFGTTERWTEKEFVSRRSRAIAGKAVRDSYLAEVARAAGLSESIRGAQ